MWFYSEKLGSSLILQLWKYLMLVRMSIRVCWKNVWPRIMLIYALSQQLLTLQNSSSKWRRQILSFLRDAPRSVHDPWSSGFSRDRVQFSIRQQPLLKQGCQKVLNNGRRTQKHKCVTYSAHDKLRGHAK